MNRTDFLTTAGKLISGGREESYGDPRQNFQDIADGWSVLLGTKVTAAQVAGCMVWLKLARSIKDEGPDTFVDMAGYAALMGEVTLRDGGSDGGDTET